ncbi:MAG: SMP-30/gluconolactonase/LRE family protein [Planctomycetota bacterium]|nr:SMP-30/gluconolactonase/LRE family protein [Planctomycetota bacterium]MDA1248522.1 SMP-30/gluconolactonase/LRE family protein [Planctomycetota bacterium]
MTQRGLVCLGFVFVSLTLNAPARSELTRFEIERREPFAGGQSFGEVGAYERIVGRAFFEIDPKRLQNRQIVDLQHAAVNDRGLVEFSADLDLLAPKDLSKARGAALYDVNNRGRKLAVRFFNDSLGENEPKDPGNGFLMRHGWIVVWSGWDGELLPGDGRMQLNAPTAGSKKTPITGKVRYEIAVSNDGETRISVNRDAHGAYLPTASGLKSATLTWRLRPSDPRVPIPRDQFHLYMQDIDTKRKGQLPRVDLEIPAGFQKGYLYEVIYEAQDPLVHGVTFASVRDLMSALKHGTGAGNPLLRNGKPVVKRNHGFGVSQSGRYLREFLYSGFNADEDGRKVFDGLIPHVAGGGLGSFNHRFAQPTTYNSQQELHEWPSDRFPFTYEEQTDPLTRRTDGIFKRAVEDNVVPFVLHTQSSAEYWSRSGSLAHTDPEGKRDAVIPESVRIFAFGGTQHGPSGWPPSRGIGQTLTNPGDYRPLLRGLLTALDEWSHTGKSVPPSVYPTLKSGTLVDWRQPATGFPAIPGVRYPQLIQQPPAFDLGPRWHSEGIIDRQPPQIVGRYRTLTAKTGPSGNELGCLLPPEVAVPVATFAGWNLRGTEFGAQSELVKLAGSYIPFPLTRFEREWTGDPRLSIEERFLSLDDYRSQLERACAELVANRYLLSEDVAPIVDTHVKRVQSLFKQIERDTVVESGPEQLLDQGAGEGPAWHPKLGLLFSGHGGINRRDHDGKLHPHRPDAGTNGLLFDRQGRLVACEPKLRRVTRTELDGTLTVLTEQYDGHRYNQPNDLTIDSKGRIYFSDPKYGPRDNMDMQDSDGREVEGVYRIDLDGKVTRIITHEADRPNGLLVTPDDRHLFVADNNNNTVGGAHILWRFDLKPDGTIDPASRKKIYDWQTGRGPDGMIQDVDGRLYVAGGRNKPAPPFETAVRHVGGVYVFSPDGRLIDLIRIPNDEVTNCTFGESDLRSLFITAGGSLWRVRTKSSGRVIFPAADQEKKD